LHGLLRVENSGRHADAGVCLQVGVQVVRVRAEIPVGGHLGQTLEADAATLHFESEFELGDDLGAHQFLDRLVGGLVVLRSDTL